MTTMSIPDRLARARNREMPDEQLALEAVNLAAGLLAAAARQQSRAERAQAAKIARMMTDPAGKAMTMALSDQAFRSSTPARVADQVKHLTARYGVPKYLEGWERAALAVGNIAGRALPTVVVPAIVEKLRAEMRGVILPGEEAPLRAYLSKRRAAGTRLNLNKLGEAILGEEEAARRLKANLELLARDDVEYISVKISSVFSQIHLIAFEDTVAQIQQRLRALYSAALAHTFAAADGSRHPKFVNLDMEEYRDLHLTAEAFKRTLDEPEFFHLRAGIVLQAYLPDAHVMQQDLTEWAQAHVARGGAPIKIRIVKGANLAMERVDASWHGWSLAPYRSKPEVDANYKRMLTYGCQPERARAVNLGVASHNIFDLAYGMLVRARHGVEEFVEFEMLEGMANHQARAVQSAAGGLLLYAPVVKRDDFHSAIAYLVRRLDENTSDDNFLHDLFGMQPGGEKFERQKSLFLHAARDQHTAGLGPQRTQNRAAEARAFDLAAPFANEPDTDWSLRHNVRWIGEIIARWRDCEPPTVPLQIAGEFIAPAAERTGTGEDPSRPGRIAYRYAQATPGQIDAALDAARGAQADWRAKPVAERARLLTACAGELARARGDLIGAMTLDGGKAAGEADVEVSEAIDFANYYARAFDMPGLQADEATFAPLGTVLVTPPWNFPLAIPAGGVLAALMAGNTVILKPAPEAVLTGWELCKRLWRAGIPMDVLQFVPTTDDEAGRGLVTDDRINAVILTGAYATARMFLGWKPELRLLGETSGKNSMIITAMADHDQAIKDLVKSAFGHAGQKCSAASLAVLEAEVYDNPAFLRQLRDAAASLKVGPAWDPASIVTPVIRAPGAELARGLTQLDEGETWLLEPRQMEGNPNLWSPGIKLGVKRGSWYQRTECFGPLLGLIRARDLDDAIDIVNDSQLGLTSGLQSLDDREVARWRERIEAGNAYINRGITGAIVQRQPFGGWKRSAFGEAKAGGPNYVAALGTWTQAGPPAQRGEPSAEIHALVSALCHGLADGDRCRERTAIAAQSYAHAWKEHFSVEHDPSQVLGERNDFRYRPVRRALVRVEDPARTGEGMLAVLAARTCGVPVTLSLAPGVEGPQSAAGVEIVREDSALFAGRVRAGGADRVRLCGTPTRELLEAAHEGHTWIESGPVLLTGRLELRHYLREQVVTQTTHRYGNIFK